VIEAPQKPTFYFVGVSTSGSLSMKLFPKWLETIGLPETVIQGHNIEVRGEARKYREIVGHVKNEPRALGALVTTHKIDIVRSAADLFDFMDTYARIFGEISCISKRAGKLAGYAKDPVSSGLALEAFLPPSYWVRHPEAQAFVIGAGGSGIALSAYLMRKEHGDNVPRKVIISNRRAGPLQHCREVHDKIGGTGQVEYVRLGPERTNDQILAGLPPRSLVVNATGMGKDLPGSPLSGGSLLPKQGYAWEFNYRGSLEFLHQAERQRAARDLVVEDGLTYFVYGWALVIGEVFHRELGPEDLARLRRVTYSFLGGGPDQSRG
jgi:shikimate dehydrogenase